MWLLTSNAGFVATHHLVGTPCRRRVHGGTCVPQLLGERRGLPRLHAHRVGEHDVPPGLTQQSRDGVRPSDDLRLAVRLWRMPLLVLHHLRRVAAVARDLGPRYPRVHESAAPTSSIPLL